MTSEPRKATDILLELEKKLDVALSIIRAQDLNIKIISNKLNSLEEKIKSPVEVPRFSVEAVAPVSPFQVQSRLDENQIPVSSEDALPLEAEPNGFRRTSRPETFAGDDSYLPKSSSAVKGPSQKPPPGRGGPVVPNNKPAEIIVPQAPQPKVEPAPKQNPVIIQNAIPVMQRVVNGHGKSLFLADVEIVDLSNMQPIFKTRTNGTGKWMASLGVGNYRVIIRKLEAATKERLEVTQDILIDGSQSPFELQTVIIKS